MKPTRRQILGALAVLGLAPFGACHRPSPAEPLLRALIEEMPLPDPLAVGQAILRSTRKPRDSDHMLRDLLRDLPLSEPLPSIRRTFAHQIREDFAYHRTTWADGWLVSLTEARFCAFLALGQKNRGGRP